MGAGAGVSPFPLTAGCVWYARRLPFDTIHLRLVVSWQANMYAMVTPTLDHDFGVGVEQGKSGAKPALSRNCEVPASAVAKPGYLPPALANDRRESGRGRG
jgi:hypothetical protein